MIRLIFSILVFVCTRTHTALPLYTNISVYNIIRERSLSLSLCACSVCVLISALLSLSKTQEITDGDERDLMNNEEHYNCNNRGDEGATRWCYFHPKQDVIGVCPFCLNERLLILASKQGSRRRRLHHYKLPPVTSFPKIFAFGSFFNRLELRNWKSDDDDRADDDFEDDDDDADAASASHDDSFISIKFEENGVASWEKDKDTKVSNKVSIEQCNMTWNNNHNLSNDKESKSVIIEHAKPRASSLRWRKRIGHLFQLVRWKRSNIKQGNNVCHVGSKVDGVKVRKSWIRTLTKRRTKD